MCDDPADLTLIFRSSSDVRIVETADIIRRELENEGKSSCIHEVSLDDLNILAQTLNEVAPYEERDVLHDIVFVGNARSDSFVSMYAVLKALSNGWENKALERTIELPYVGGLTRFSIDLPESLVQGLKKEMPRVLEYDLNF